MTMIADWFHDRLQRSGHLRLDRIGYNHRNIYATADGVIKNFKDIFHKSCGLVYPISEQDMERSEAVMALIEEQEYEFGPWTSFRDENRVYFVFLHQWAATQFKLLLI